MYSRDACGCSETAALQYYRVAEDRGVRSLFLLCISGSQTMRHPRQLARGLRQPSARSPAVPFGKYDCRTGSPLIENEAMHLLLIYRYQIQSHRHNRSLLYTKGRSKIPREQFRTWCPVEQMQVSKARVCPLESATYLVTKVLSHITKNHTIRS